MTQWRRETAGSVSTTALDTSRPRVVSSSRVNTTPAACPVTPTSRAVVTGCTRACTPGRASPRARPRGQWRDELGCEPRPEELPGDGVDGRERSAHDALQLPRGDLVPPPRAVHALRRREPGTRQVRDEVHPPLRRGGEGPRQHRAACLLEVLDDHDAGRARETHVAGDHDGEVREDDAPRDASCLLVLLARHAAA